MKTCTRCQETKDLSEFSPNGDRVNSHCKKCRSQVYKQRYQQTAKEQVRQRIKRLENRVAAMRYVQDIKISNPCTDCKKNYSYYVMQFDHLDPNTKVANVATMVSQGASIERLKKEIAKCELVCANCHAERTHKRRIRGMEDELESCRSRLDTPQVGVV